MAKKDYRLDELIDIPLFQTLLDKLNLIYDFPSAIIDNDGKVLTATAWQDICVKFHRVHPDCLKDCQASDKYILAHLGEAKPAVTYKCPRGLVDNATPIVIGGRHLANFFTGQFFLEKPDPEFFRAQARKYGFDDKEYLAAVAKVPIWTKEKLDKYLDFVKGFTEIIAGLGYKNLQEREARESVEQKDKELDSERRRTERIMEVSPAGIVYVDASGAITYANRRAEELLGLSRSELAGRTYNAPAWKPTHTDGTPFREEEQPFSVVNRTMKPVSGIEQIITWPDGRRVMLTINGTPLLSDKGEFLGMVAALDDITARKQAQLALEKANRDMAEKKQDMENFLYITSHDLRSPLINIQGFSQNLGKYLKELRELLEPLPEEKKAAMLELIEQKVPESLEFIEEGVLKMDGMITALLKIARLGRVEILAGPVEANAVLKNVVAALSYQLGQAGGEVKIGLLPPCRADAAFISQLFTNLLDNAIKYRDKSRKLEVTVSGETKGGAVIYTVSDNGLGIKAEDLGKLGQVFYRGSSARDAAKGEGIGLAMVKRMAEMNGGRLWAESKEGEGTRFFVELPGG